MAIKILHTSCASYYILIIIISTLLFHARIGLLKGDTTRRVEMLLWEREEGTEKRKEQETYVYHVRGYT